MNNKLLAASLFTLATTSAIAAEKQLPNIVVFISDDLGLNECEPYGAVTVQTPNIARLSTEGMTFNQAYVAAPYSGPSRASLFSGVMPPRHGEIANQYAPRMEMMTMVSNLQELGYEVVSLGKTTHGYKLAERLEFDYLERDQGPHPVDDTLVMSAVNKFIEAPRSGKPLCVFVGDRRPHSPWLNESIYDTHNDPSYPSNIIDTQESRDLWGRYITEVTHMDQCMGRVDRAFQEYFGDDKFLFLFTSDHGTSWMFGKGNLYDAGIHIPMIARWSGQIEEGSRTDAMVSWIDIIPTFIDIAGGKVDKSIDGISFKDVLFGKSDKHHEYIFATHNSQDPADYINRAVRSDKFKYIRNYSYENYFFMVHEMLRTENAQNYWGSWEEKVKRDPESRAILDRYRVRPYEELYDIVNDPMECNNLAADPNYKKELNKMAKVLDNWMEQQGDEIKLSEMVFPTSGKEPSQIREELVYLFHDVKAKKLAAEKKSQSK